MQFTTARNVPLIVAVLVHDKQIIYLRRLKAGLGGRTGPSGSAEKADYLGIAAPKGAGVFFWAPTAAKVSSKKTVQVEQRKGSMHFGSWEWVTPSAFTAGGVRLICVYMNADGHAPSRYRAGNMYLTGGRAWTEPSTGLQEHYKLGRILSAFFLGDWLQFLR